MSLESRRSKSTFSQERFYWNPQRVKPLSEKVLQMLDHPTSLSEAELTVARVAYRFVHDALVGLVPPEKRVVSTDDMIAAYSMVRGLYPTDQDLKRVLGSSSNIMNALAKSRAGRLSPVEVSRTLEFFTALSASFDPNPQR